MGHAGAIIAGGKGTAQEKMDAMRNAGIYVVESPAMIGQTMELVLKRRSLLHLRKLKRKTVAKSKRKASRHAMGLARRRRKK